MLEEGEGMGRSCAGGRKRCSVAEGGGRRWRKEAGAWALEEVVRGRRYWGVSWRWRTWQRWRREEGVEERRETCGSRWPERAALKERREVGDDIAGAGREEVGCAA